MEYEYKMRGKISLGWEEVDSKCETVLDWLKINDNSSFAPSHFWWEILTKQEYRIPPNKLPELYSEIAKGIKRGESMKVVEMRDNIRKYKLHLDFDLKTTEKHWEDVQLLEMFKNDIQNCVKSYKNNDFDWSFVVTGISGRFFPSSQPEINYKYGFHFIWPNVHVTAAEHREIMNHLLKFFSSSQKFDKSIFHTWEHIFDMAIIENEVSGYRMLYSIKSFTCKMCRKKDEAKIKKTKVCENCLDTGLLDTRLGTFQGCVAE